MLKVIFMSTAIAGTLDILWATLLTTWRGRSVLSMLQFVASGPFPPAANWGLLGALVGLAVHFGLMAIMATVFMTIWRHVDQVQRNPLWSGLCYGLATYIVLDLVVVPLRFPAAWPPSSLSIATQLFAHLILVGLVFALTAKLEMPALELQTANVQAGGVASS